MKASILFLGCSTFVFVVSGLLIGSGPAIVQPPAQGDDPTMVNWLHYGNDLANTRYQNVDQINPTNVANLKVAWVFHTKVLDEKAELETSPIAVNGRLYVTDGHDDVFALNAARSYAPGGYYTPPAILGRCRKWK